MNSIRTYAKINLTLDVTEKRPDGYHNIDSIFEELSLYDIITVTMTGSENITITCNVPEIPCNEKNIVYKAADEFFRITGIKNPGINIDIQKNIPNQAGMGGGSTNAAGILRLLNNMFNAGLSDEELMSAGLKTGADTPFFIKGGLARITGIGEIIEPLSPLPSHYIVIAKGGEGVSTPQAYKEIDNLSAHPHQDTAKLLKAVSEGDLHSLMNGCLNTFELVSVPEDIEKIKHIMKKHNTIGTMMTGSGSAVFGIFTDKNDAENAYAELSRSFAFSGIYTNNFNREDPA